MSDDVKPFDAEQLDGVERDINRMVKEEWDTEDAANALDGIARRLLATARHYIQLAEGRKND